MNKWEISGIVAAVLAIISATAYVGDIKSDVKRLNEIVSNVDKESLQIWKQSVEERIREADSLPIGTLVPTILEPHDFKSIVGDKDGDNWVPADGRLIKDSQYHKITGKLRVPDMRAMFFRGHNKFDDVSGPRSDEFRDRGVRQDHAGYSSQQWSTASPKNPFFISPSGAHEHGPGNLNGKTSSNGNHTHKYLEHAFGHDLNDRGEPNKSEDNDGVELERETRPSGNHTHFVTITGGKTSSAGEHSHAIREGGDMETRPNNIGVYYMIRIN